MSSCGSPYAICRKAAEGFIKFVNASPSPFHAVSNAVAQLEAHGYTRLCESNAWHGNVLPGGKYIVTRNGSALVAFAVGTKFSTGGGFAIVGAHTDSPCLKIKPNSARRAAGYLQVGVETYGGGLWHTWFDRDLGIAGRVVLRSKDKMSMGYEELVCLAEPGLRIPSLAIHLDSSVKDAFTFNKETHLLPLLGGEMAIAKRSPNASGSSGCDSDAKANNGAGPDVPAPRHHAVLLSRLAIQCNCEPDEISDVELCLFDVQNATVGGLCGEYVFAARCDNLVMSYCALEALCNAKGMEDPNGVAVVALFDNEEVGSLSAYGAQSWLLPSVLRRIAAALQPAEAFDQSVSRSLVISADMAHAVHPNYVEKHEYMHRPRINGGVVLKHNANQRYATTAATAALVRVMAENAGVPLQDFVVRNDSPCGSTIGPILAGAMGIRCVDVGNPQLSMHSIREQAGVQDFQYAIDLFSCFFKHFSEIDKRPKAKKE